VRSNATWAILGAGIVAWLVILARAASSNVAYAPLVRAAVATPTPIATTIVTLNPDDSTFVSAAASPGGCVFLSYIDRAHGNKLLLVQDVGTHLIDVPLPAAVQSIATDRPAFAAPGDKQADGAIEIAGQVLSLYYTSRDTGDPTGPFRLKRLSMQLPACRS